MTLAEIRDLSFGYGKDRILDGIDLKFDRPGLCCILGPNGVGKTTLVKCVCRLLEPDSGSILLDGEDIRTMGRRDLAKKVAFVPNSESSVFAMTVSEAVLMGRHPRSGWAVTDGDMAAVEDAMDKLGLSEYADRRIDEISAGQLQRVMIARGLAQEPEILILDEPTSNLDIKYQMEVMRFLRRYTREKDITVLMVCHDLNVAAAYADRVILMDDGRIFADGTAPEVLTESNVRAVYGVRSAVTADGGVPHVILLPETDDLPEPKPYREKKEETPNRDKPVRTSRTAAAVAVAVLLLGGVFLGIFASGGDDDGSSLLGAAIDDETLNSSGSRLWVFGNADLDDRLDGNDVAYLENVLAGTAEENILCDTNCDGKVNGDDLAHLKKIVSAMTDGSETDVYYVDSYGRAAKVSWPVKSIAIGYCSGMYAADLAGLMGKVALVDSSIKDYWMDFCGIPSDTGSYGDTDYPNYEVMIREKIDVYVPGYCSAEADGISASALEPAGIDVMFMNTCDNSGVDVANTYIDRSLTMFAFLLQGDMDNVYAYLEWYDGLFGKISGYAPAEKAAMVMARNCSTYNGGTYSITGYNNTNNIHAEWANIYAVGQHSPSLGRNYNNLPAESVLGVIKTCGYDTVYYVDNEHDGTRGQYRLDECVAADRENIKDPSADIRYLGIAREVGNSPLYIIEMAFYQNVMYGNSAEIGSYTDLFAYYFEHFSSFSSVPDITRFFYDGGGA